MATDEATVCDFREELFRTCGVRDATCKRAAYLLGETRVIDMIGVLDCFSTVSMIMNAAPTRPPEDDTAPVLRGIPVQGHRIPISGIFPK